MGKPALIPFPRNYREMEGTLELYGIGRISIPDELKTETDHFLSVSGLAMTENDPVLEGKLSSSIHEEGYFLRISKDSINIEAGGASGFHHALETIRQMLILCGHTIPCAEIEDSPQFGWRGFMLDCCRHFMPVEYIKKLIDAMSLLKLSVFHWHLTDDQGWRIEIKSHPELTEKGSTRKKRTSPESMTKCEFFTQDEIKDVIEYAARRHITVVPEIECPGHVSALLTAIPEAGCSGGPYEVETRTGVFPDVLCIGNEKPYEILDDVFREVAELFPSEYIHIGGDECPHTRWDNCPKCQALMQKEGLKSPQELQWYFSQRVIGIVKKYGKKPIGWDEIANSYPEKPLDKCLTIMLWRGPEVASAVLENGNDIILARCDDGAYIDYRQTENEYEPGNLGITTLRASYSSTLHYPCSNESGTIIGGQGNLWTEKILFPNNATYMIFPRLAAIAEVYWLGDDRKLDDFMRRVKELPVLLENEGLNPGLCIPE